MSGDMTVRHITYRTGESRRARTLTVDAVPDAEEIIDGKRYRTFIRATDGVRIAIRASRIVSVESKVSR